MVLFIFHEYSYSHINIYTWNIYSTIPVRIPKELFMEPEQMAKNSQDTTDNQRSMDELELLKCD